MMLENIPEGTKLFPTERVCAIYMARVIDDIVDELFLEGIIVTPHQQVQYVTKAIRLLRPYCMAP